MRIYWIKGLFKGNLGMTAKPRGGDWLLQEMEYLRNQNVTTLVSLLTHSELVECSLMDEASIAQDVDLNYISFPIDDRSVPSNRNSFDSLIKRLYTELQKSQNVVVHCRMGIGRTGMVCAGLLLHVGEVKSNVFERLSKIRTLEVPDTDEQKKWLLKGEYV